MVSLVFFVGVVVGWIGGAFLRRSYESVGERQRIVDFLYGMSPTRSVEEARKAIERGEHMQ